MPSDALLRALRRGARGLRRRPWRADVPAGVVLGVESVPDGLAGGLLAGVNPVWGLYAYMVGVTAGAATTSSAFMAVQATGAMAVVVADVPQVHAPAPDPDTALFTLSVLTGVIMLTLGLARLGSAVRFVPHAVLTGFVSAVAVNIVLGQLDDFTGYEAEGSNRLTSTLDTVLHVGSFAWGTVLVGVATIALIVLLERTALRALGLVVAVAATSGVAGALRTWTGAEVAVLADVTDVPAALPSVSVPDVGLVLTLLVPAASLAFVGLVQGAAISATVPNPDGRYGDASGDFRGQGVANIASGLLHGMPVGGSMSATALVTTAGARSRTALVVAGATMAVVILLLADAVAYVAMPALAGLLIVIGARSLRPAAIALVWRTGPVQATVMVTTFALTVLIPLQYAVLVGVGISVILHVVRQSGAVRVRRWELTADGGVVESDPPRTLGPDETVVLRPYGSLFFAAVPVLEAQLPRVEDGSRRSAVVISLRGKEQLGSTFLTVVSRYATQLDSVGSVLLLAGVSPDVRRQLDALGDAVAVAPQHVLDAEPTLTASTRRAVRLADEWRRWA
ncbi:SulP family inorganic anion transporter [Cellulomonas sp. Marseille-Q8402]